MFRPDIPFRRYRLYDLILCLYDTEPIASEDHLALFIILRQMAQP